MHTCRISIIITTCTSNNHNVGPVYTMDHRRWSFTMVRLHAFMVQFLKKKIKKFTKPLGPSLGGNRVWTKRNDHAPTIKCVNFLMYAKKDNFEMKRRI